MIPIVKTTTQFCVKSLVGVVFYTSFGAFAAASTIEQFAAVMNAPDATTIPVKLSARTAFANCIVDQVKVLNVTKHLIRGDHAFTSYELSRLDSGLKFPCAAFAISPVDDQRESETRLFFRNLYKIRDSFSVMLSDKPAQIKSSVVENLIATIAPSIKSFNDPVVQDNLSIFVDQLMGIHSLYKKLVAIDDAKSKSDVLSKRLSRAPNPNFVASLPKILPQEFSVYSSVRINVIYDIIRHLVEHCLHDNVSQTPLQDIVRKAHIDISTLKSLALHFLGGKPTAADISILKMFETLPSILDSAEMVSSVIKLIDSINSCVFSANFIDEISKVFLGCKVAEELITFCCTRAQHQTACFAFKCVFNEICTMYYFLDSSLQESIGLLVNKALVELSDSIGEINVLEKKLSISHKKLILPIFNGVSDMLDRLYVCKGLYHNIGAIEEKIVKSATPIITELLDRFIITGLGSVPAISAKVISADPIIDITTLYSRISSVNERMVQLNEAISLIIERQFELIQKTCDSFFIPAGVNATLFDRYIQEHFSPSIGAALGKFSENLTDNVFGVEKRREIKENLGFSIQRDFALPDFEEFICGEPGYMASIGTHVTLRSRLRGKFPATKVTAAIKGEMKPEGVLVPGTPINSNHLNIVYLATFFPQ